MGTASSSSSAPSKPPAASGFPEEFTNGVCSDGKGKEAVEVDSDEENTLEDTGALPNIPLPKMAPLVTDGFPL